MKTTHHKHRNTSQLAQHVTVTKIHIHPITTMTPVPLSQPQRQLLQAAKKAVVTVDADYYDDN
jgi:hypothetical protein